MFQGLTQLGRYTLLGRLASGGMAELFLARQAGPQGFHKTVVIKRILEGFARDEHFVQMFLDEARYAALINHPNVVSIFELGEEKQSGNYYIVMEHIDGPNLKKLAHVAITAKGMVPLGIACRIIADACAALDFAHDLCSESGEPLDLVHRDVSPENILISYNGQVKLVDFGIAKALSREGLTQVGHVKGKFGYMAPEQVTGAAVNRRTDIWALGITLYWLFTGVKPIRGANELELAQKITEGQIVPPEELRQELPPELSRIVMRALRKDPAARYPTAGEMQGALERWMSSSGNLITTTVLASYVNGLFPADHPDRQIVRSLSSVPSEAFTPTDMPLATLVSQTEPGVTDQGDDVDLSELRELSRDERRRRWMLLGVGSASTLALIGVLALAVRGSSRPLPPPSAAPSDAIAAPIATAVVPPVVVSAVVPAAAVAVTPPRTAAGPSPAVPAPIAPAPVAEVAAHAAVAKPKARAHEGHGDPGTVAFHVAPWADVYLDGRFIGTTPFQPVSIASGHHGLRLVNEPLGVDKQVGLDVKGGEASTFSTHLK